MSSIWKFTAIAFLLIHSFLETKASHAVGADLFYECLGNNQYRITLNFYRDCAGIAAPTNSSGDAGDRTVTIRSASCNRNLSLVLTRTSFREVPAICPAQQNQSRCRGGTLPGIEQHVYSAVITLPAQCTDWVVGYDLCCRNSAITNLQSPGSYDLYVEARINNSGGLCNNSPIFTTLPVPYICANQQYFYNHGAVDIDGDSLVYRFVNPLHNPNSNIPYTGGQNINNPMRTSGAFQFNTQTGQMSFTPSQTQQAVVTVLVQEYRNGVLIGSSMRDIQVVVLNCNNAPPISSPITNVTGGTPVGSNAFSIDVCSGNQICFDVNSSDPNSNQVLTMTWNNGIPGATFTQTGQPPVARFCWTPGPNDVGLNNFVVEVLDNACPIPGRSTRNYSISVFNSSLNINTSTTPVSCASTNNGTATATVVGGVAPIRYAWSNGQTTSTATGLAIGNHTVTVQDAGSCPVVRTVTITGPPKINVSFTTTSAVCNGEQNGTVLATTSGGNGGPFTYLWSNGETTAFIDSLASGAYFLTVRDNANCPFDTLAFIFQPGPLIITATASATSNYNGRDISCAGAADGEVTLIVDGGTQPYIYNWSPNANGQNDSIIRNLGPGLYSVTLYDQNGCNTGAFITLTEPAPVTATTTVISDVTCFGLNNGAASAAGTGGTSPFDYLWSASANNQNTAIANNLPGGLHTVTVTDINGCSATATASLNSAGPLTLNVNPISNYNGFNVTCFGSTNGRAIAATTGGTPPFNYSWGANAGNQNTDIAFDISAGNYAVTVTDAKGCTISGNTTLIEPPIITNTIAVTSNYNGFDVSCFGAADGSATVTVSGGVPGYLYQWYDTLNQTSATANTLNANIPYVVRITDLNECSIYDTIILNEPTPIIVNTAISSNYNGEHISCFGASDGSATVNATGGVPTYNYLWSNNQNDTIATNLNAATYSVTATDLNNCTASNTITLVNPAQLNITTTVTSNYNGRDISCFGFSDGSVNATASGGVLGFSYQWDAATNNQSTSNATNLSVGNYNVTATDLNGCTVAGNITVTQPDFLVVSVATSDVVCFGENNGYAIATASGGTTTYNYTWSNNGSLNNSNNRGLSIGNYGLTVTDINNCTANTSFIINEPSLLVTDTTTRPATCFETPDGFAAVIASGGIGNYSYAWSGYNVTDSLYDGFLRGIYTVTVTDGNGCSSAETVLISSPDATSVKANVIGEDQSTYFGDTIQLQAINTSINFPQGVGVNFFWNPQDGLSCNNCSNPLAYPIYTTLYEVTMIDDRGCIASDTLLIYIDPQTKVLYVPNAFTPNGDGINDIFYVYAAGAKEIDFIVFNRWGEKIFQSYSINEGWDGYYKDNLMNPGVYVYYVVVTYLDGATKTAKGSVTLVR
jgi:gliding motility-associated-like protein